jgi:segregation and condensation protein A
MAVADAPALAAHATGPAISLPHFEGPLELLLHLIEREDLDITEVSLVAVADQYLAAIRTDEGWDAGALAEFIAIGAKLVYLKSRALLPLPPVVEEESEEDEVGRELVDMLVEYRRYAVIADDLERRQEEGVRQYLRMAPPPPRPEGPGLDGVTLEAMRKMMLSVLKRRPPSPRALVPRMKVSLVQRISVLRERLQRQGRFSFRALMTECETRTDVIVAFLAVLELLKSGECDARQDEAWGDIEVVSVVRISHS